MDRPGRWKGEKGDPRLILCVERTPNSGKESILILLGDKGLLLPAVPVIILREGDASNASPPPPPNGASMVVESVGLRKSKILSECEAVRESLISCQEEGEGTVDSEGR